MKKLFRMLALVLAMSVLLTACAFAEEGDAPAATDQPAQAADSAPEAAEDPVLFTFNGQEILRSQVDEYLSNLYSNGYVETLTEYETAIEYMIQEKVLEDQIEKQQLNQFTAEEEEALRADAEKEWEDALASYVSYFLSEDTDEARAKARQDAEAYYQSYGVTQQQARRFDRQRLRAAYDKLTEKALEGKAVEPTEEEIRQIFEEYAEQDKQTYENNISLYETYQRNGYEIWYQPAGYRGVLHILLDTDEELLSAYQSAQVAYEEALSSEDTAADSTQDTAEGDAAEAPAPVTQADVDVAREALLAHHQKEIDDIYARLEAGESFESLIAVYGDDPGMRDETRLKEGYSVHKDSTQYYPEFTAAAFSDKMQKPGDVSDPIISTAGIHILYYLRDIPEGNVELNDDIHEEIQSYLENVKKNEVLSAAYDAWKQECEIVRNEDAIAAAIGDTAAEILE